MDELAEYMQGKSECLVEDNHADDMFCCETNMDAHYKKLIRKMNKMCFEEDSQAKEIDGVIVMPSEPCRESGTTSDFVEVLHAN